MTLEQRQGGYEGDPTRPKYPAELVEKYGAKAGILIYIAERLPDIPQAPMVVNELGETTESLLARADNVGIKWPRLFRSSAVAELTGYEGSFPTRRVLSYEEGHAVVSRNPNNYSLYRNSEYFERGIKKEIDQVRYSPLRIKEAGEGQDLPDEINVIIAEQSPSLFIGTYIKHPNKEGVFLTTITSKSTIDTNDADRTSFSISVGGVRELERYSLHHFGGEELEKQLAEVASWHDRIASLSDMDPSWSWQIEFGVDPVCLFQVRPFKPMKRPTFTLKPSSGEKYSEKPIVIGTTSSPGLVLRVVDENTDPTTTTNEDCLYMGYLRGSWRAEEFRNLKANILTMPYGFLQHNDVRVMRIAEVSVLTPSTSDLPEMGAGDQVRIISDGERVEIRNLTTRETR